MTTLDDVYREFGDAAEAAQLLETELGNMALQTHFIEERLMEQNDPRRARDIFDSINRKTLGQLLENLKNPLICEMDPSRGTGAGGRGRRNRRAGFFVRG